MAGGPAARSSRSVAPLPAPLDPADDEEKRGEIEEPGDVALGDGSHAADRNSTGRRSFAEGREVGGDRGEILVGDLARVEDGHHPGTDPDRLADLGRGGIEERRGGQRPTHRPSRPRPAGPAPSPPGPFGQGPRRHGACRPDPADRGDHAQGRDSAEGTTIEHHQDVAPDRLLTDGIAAVRHAYATTAGSSHAGPNMSDAHQFLAGVVIAATIATLLASLWSVISARRSEGRLD